MRARPRVGRGIPADSPCTALSGHVQLPLLRWRVCVKGTLRSGLPCQHRCPTAGGLRCGATAARPGAAPSTWPTWKRCTRMRRMCTWCDQQGRVDGAKYRGVTSCSEDVAGRVYTALACLLRRPPAGEACCRTCYHSLARLRPTNAQAVVPGPPLWPGAGAVLGRRAGGGHEAAVQRAHRRLLPARRAAHGGAVPRQAHHPPRHQARKCGLQRECAWSRVGDSMAWRWLWLAWVAEWHGAAPCPLLLRCMCAHPQTSMLTAVPTVLPCAVPVAVERPGGPAQGD